MQATNNTNTSATLNGYSITAAAPLSGDDPHSSAPLAAPGSKPEASKLAPLVGRRLLGVPTLGNPHRSGQLGSGRQQQLVLNGFSPGNADRSQLAGLPTQHTQHAQRVQQMLSRMRQALEAAVVKLADYAIAAPQHAQQLLSRTTEAVKAAVSKLTHCSVVVPQHAQQLLSSTIQAVKAAVSNLDCGAAAPQHAQQLLSRTKPAAKAAVSKHADHVAALYNSAHHQSARFLGRFGTSLHQRVLAAGTPNSVDVEVTVNVPSGQSGSATQARIEGPGFAPALQQSLSNAGMLALRHEIFCFPGWQRRCPLPARQPDSPEMNRNNSIVCMQSGTCPSGAVGKDLDLDVTEL